MKTIPKLLLFSISAAVSLHAETGRATSGKETVPLPSIDLRNALKPIAPPLPTGHWKLAPEWFGTMMPIAISKEERPDLFPTEPDRPTPLRLVEIYQRRLHGFSPGKIPSIAELKSVKTLADLRKLGMNSGPCCGGGGGETQSFTSYAMNSEGELVLTRVSTVRYYSLSADRSIREKENPLLGLKRLRISRGVFHPVDPK